MKPATTAKAKAASLDAAVKPRKSTRATSSTPTDDPNGDDDLLPSGGATPPTNRPAAKRARKPAST